jgi:hypothetical protein
MDRYRRQIEGAVSAVTVYRDLSHSWFGARSAALPRDLRRRLPDAAKRAYVVQTLQARLYGSFYAYGHAVKSAPPPIQARSGGDRAFAAALSAANCGSGRWEGGWKLVRHDGARAIIRRGGLDVAAALDACRSPGGGQPSAGEDVEVKAPKELPASSPGFYMAVGDAPQGEAGPLVRVYWNLDPANAIELIRLGTMALNRDGIPFHLKVLDLPAAYGRCDAGVLYIQRRDWTATAEAIASFRDRISRRDPVPALTKPLAPGIGLAEDPGNGESFGLDRCGLLATALFDATSLAGAGSPMQTAMRRFEAAGIEAATPYLSPGSRDVYELP